MKDPFYSPDPAIKFAVSWITFIIIFITAVSIFVFSWLAHKGYPLIGNAQAPAISEEYENEGASS